MNEILLGLNLPLSIQLSAKKKFILNLNNYRNLHYRLLSQAKVKYTDLLLTTELVGKQKITDAPLTFEYTYYAQSKRLIDIANPLCVIDKFTMDAIVKAGIIEDDNSKIVNAVVFKFGGYDKENPRAELRAFKTLGE
jgi:hypothetical protein